MTKIIGLTGGIGSGKTTVSRMFEKLGVPIFNSDLEARLIMNDKDIISKISLLFNDIVIDENGLLDRKKISNIVFKDKEKLKELNAIIHPLIKSHFNNWLKTHKNKKYVIKETAILFENNGQDLCDATILVTAPDEVRIQRVMNRDNKSREEVLQVMANQMPETEKMKLANYLIVNVDLKESCEKVYNLHKKLNII